MVSNKRVTTMQKVQAPKHSFPYNMTSSIKQEKQNAKKYNILRQKCTTLNCN